ncbi:prepilin peptidase [Halorarius litoreus]|uniref:prepilin peptidase n=1 Tax=Halorarius litoreus TaxID=2962676 RepID=UPI0020CC958C|nr:prepilin peptidase [Halorarius litoreus]
MLASPPTDLLRLLVVPIFGWAAARDIATRRVPNQTWLPLVVLGVLLLAVDVVAVLGADPFRQRLFVIHLVVSLGLVAPLGYVFWRLGGFGGADAKAVMVLALLFPEFPRYFLPGEVLPLVQPPLGVFSLTILSNTVLLGLGYPLVLAARNAARGHRSLVMFVGKSVPVSALSTAYGSLLETPAGFTRNGLDLDALRMYLRWRGLTLSELRGDPDTYRDPASLPPEDERADPGDGALADGMPIADGGSVAPGTGADAPAADPVDEWGAATFLASIEGDAYGTTPEKLRGGLEVISHEEEVWLTPGMPFIVPMFVGLVVALGFGDLLYAVLQVAGLVP